MPPTRRGARHRAALCRKALYCTPLIQSGLALSHSNEPGARLIVELCEAVFISVLELLKASDERLRRCTDRLFIRRDPTKPTRLIISSIAPPTKPTRGDLFISRPSARGEHFISHPSDETDHSFDCNEAKRFVGACFRRDHRFNEEAGDHFVSRMLQESPSSC